MGVRERRRKQLPDEPTEKRRHRKLKEGSLDGAVWRTVFRRESRLFVRPAAW